MWFLCLLQRPIVLLSSRRCVLGWCLGHVRHEDDRPQAKRHWTACNNTDLIMRPNTRIQQYGHQHIYLYIYLGIYIACFAKTALSISWHTHTQTLESLWMRSSREQHIPPAYVHTKQQNTHSSCASCVCFCCWVSKYFAEPTFQYFKMCPANMWNMLRECYI